MGTHGQRTALALGGLLLCLAGCASAGDSAGAGTLNPVGGVPATSATPGTAQPSAAAPTPTQAPSTATTQSTVSAVAPLTCGKLKSAEVGSATVSYNGYHDGIPLGGLGLWSGEDGNTVTLGAPCGIGDLDGDGAPDAVGVVSLTSGGTGDFYTLVVWHDDHGNPVCVAVTDLGDRNPVGTIQIAGGKATVVYYTRTDDAPMAEVNIQRTAVFTLAGNHFTEQSHVDVQGTFSP